MGLQEIIDKSKDIVFFGGAGVSTESGIPDFRSADGIYNTSGEKYPPEEIISHDFFFKHTKEFYDFYLKKMVYPNAKPNAAHLKLAEMEQKGKLHSIVTQNIDGLHQKAGSKNVIELHGSVLRNNCIDCGKKYKLDYLLKSDGIPKCTCGGIIKPDVVLYGENLNESDIEHAINDISSCDTLIVAGTSLNVYPAAGMIRYFRGDNLVLINRDKTPYDAMCTLVMHEKVGEVLSKIIIK